MITTHFRSTLCHFVMFHPGSFVEEDEKGKKEKLQTKVQII